MVSHGSSCSSHARMARGASKIERQAFSICRMVFRWSRVSPCGHCLSRCRTSSAPMLEMVLRLTKIREQSREHLDPVPQVLDADVLVGRVLVVVVVDDRKANDRYAAALKEVHRHAPAERR